MGIYRLEAPENFKNNIGKKLRLFIFGFCLEISSYFDKRYNTGDWGSRSFNNR